MSRVAVRTENALHWQHRPGARPGSRVAKGRRRKELSCSRRARCRSGLQRCPRRVRRHMSRHSSQKGGAEGEERSTPDDLASTGCAAYEAVRECRVACLSSRFRSARRNHPWSRWNSTSPRCIHRLHFCGRQPSVAMRSHHASRMWAVVRVYDAARSARTAFSSR